MKNTRIVAGLIFTVLFLMAFPSISFGEADDKGERKLASYQSIEATKVWTVQFNTEIAQDSVNNDSVYVLDSNNNRVNTTVYLASDQKSARVEPPEEGYNPGETYHLIVSGSIYSKDHVLAKEGYSIDFEVKPVESPEQTETPEQPVVPDDSTDSTDHSSSTTSSGEVLSFGTVTADILNIRSGPSTDTEVLGKLQYGDKVDIYAFDGHWAKIRYDGKAGYLHKTYLKLRKANGSLLEDLNIVIDAGHGDQDPGAIYGDSQEKEINLDVSLRVGQKLAELGANPKLTRTTDEFLELYERVQYTKDNYGDIFVSIHVNSASTSAMGAEVYYYKNKPSNEFESYLLAQKIQEQLVQLVEMKDRGVKDGEFHVIRENEVPAVLVELGFLTNELDREKLKSDEYRDLFAEAVTQGIVNYYSEEVK